jgi:hypothetical protein
MIELDILGNPVKEARFWKDRDDRLQCDVEVYLVKDDGKLFPYGSHRRLLYGLSQSLKAQSDRIDRLYERFGVPVLKESE